MSNPTIAQLQQGLKDAHTAVVTAIDGVMESEAHEVPEQEEWTVAQLLAHIAEIQSFWMGKAVLITQEVNPEITRNDVENDVRINAVTDHSGDDLPTLIHELYRVNNSVVATVGTINPSDLTLLGHRGDGNPMTVADVLQYLAGHVELHARQIKDSLTLIRKKH